MIKNKKKPLLVYFNNYPAPYVIERLNALVENEYIDVEAWFLNRNSNKMGWIDGDKSSWKFKYKFYNGFPLFFTQNFKKPDLLISLYSSSIFLLNILFYKIFKTKIFLHTVKTFDTWNKRSLIKNILKKIIFNLVSGFHSNGYDTKKQIKQFLIKKSTFLLVPWNMNLSYNQNIKPKYKRFKNRIKFLYTGRIIKNKGLDILIDAMFELKKKKKKFQLEIVGDGDYLDVIKKKVKLFNLDKNIFFFKKQSSEKLTKFYIKNHIYIFPTTGDPYGMVIDEALSFFMPVITSNNVGELNLRIKNRKNGIIFKSGSKKSLVESIMTYYNEPNLILKHSKNCKGIIPENYSVIYAKKIIKLIHSF